MEKPLSSSSRATFLKALIIALVVIVNFGINVVILLRLYKIIDNKVKDMNVDKITIIDLNEYLSSDQYKENAKVEPDPNPCPNCYETMLFGTQEICGHLATPGGSKIYHWFHEICFNQWKSQCASDKKYFSCPSCNMDLANIEIFKVKVQVQE